MVGVGTGTLEVTFSAGTFCDWLFVFTLWKCMSLRAFESQPKSLAIPPLQDLCASPLPSTLSEPTQSNLWTLGPQSPPRLSWGYDM